MSNICPGCGRCKDCGRPAPRPQPGIPPLNPEPWREGNPYAPRPYLGPLRITCHVDRRAISQAILG